VKLLKENISLGLSAFIWVSASNFGWRFHHSTVEDFGGLAHVRGGDACCQIKDSDFSSHQLDDQPSLIEVSC
jgi:hypothetical protein